MVKQARAAAVEAPAAAGRRFEGPCYCRPFFTPPPSTVSTCIASNGKMIAPLSSCARSLRLGPHGRRGERRARPCAVTGSRQMPSLLIGTIMKLMVRQLIFRQMPMVSAHREDLEAIG
jgi:hypothetical protein